MKKRTLKNLFVAFVLLTLFIAWTILVSFVNVQPIGPKGSSVGFSSLNKAFHSFTGTNMLLYIVTDWLGLIPALVILGFGALGLFQWIKRKSILKVDRSILVLGVFYIAVICVYLMFENVVINYRPTLIEGCLEVSYPSSTTMLVMCVMPTAAMQLRTRMKNTLFGRFVCIAIAAFTAFMVIGRLISGVHWVTDIIGGALISAGLVLAYRTFAE
jgi:undecaprenyl-diphosphatase